MSNVVLTLSVLSERLAVCRLGPGSGVPAWAMKGAFFSITRTADELSIVCSEGDVPPGVTCERCWRALKLEGPFDFAATGILVAVAGPLAEAGISLLPIGTYDTDYVLVREGELERAVAVLVEWGHRVRW